MKLLPKDCLQACSILEHPIMNGSNDAPNHDLLRDILPVPTDLESVQTRQRWKPRKTNKGEAVDPEPETETGLGRYTLSKVPSGFAVTRGRPGAATPAELRITVAYDRRRGPPLAKYSPYDFKLNEAPMTVRVSGGQIMEQRLNRLVVKVTEPGFRVTVTGFDENRDLYVDVRAEEETDDPQA
jgi:hypothetical protein